MTRPRIASEAIGEGAMPCCPHCRCRNLHEATLTFGALVDAWDGLHERLDVDGDGYAWVRGGLTIDCPDCGHPSRIRIDGRRVALIAARTDADRRLLEGAAA